MWMQVTKIDAAKRQLEVAIRLYFSNQDPISIHTLTGAAYNILRDITKHNNVTEMLIKDQLMQFVKPEHMKLVQGKVNEAENFFKHADRDPDSHIAFNTEQTTIMLWDACLQYCRMFEENPPLLNLYNIWFLIKRPDLFNLSSQQRSVVRSSWIDMERTEFYQTVLPVMMELGNHGL